MKVGLVGGPGLPTSLRSEWIRMVWRVKDTNLGRHQPTDLQNKACTTLTSGYAPQFSPGHE
jgi:hypothetical protein